MIGSITWPKLFLFSVLALYAFYIVRWLLRSIRARLTTITEPLREAARGKQAEIARAIEKSKGYENPFAPRPDLAEFLTPIVERLERKLTGVDEEPIMRERINSGSDSYLQSEGPTRLTPGTKPNRTP